MAHTNEQWAIITHVQQTRFNEVVQLLSFAKRCEEAVVPLPSKNEHGESVVHGNNMDMHRIASDYAYVVQTLIGNLPSERLNEIADMFPNWRRWMS